MISKNLLRVLLSGALISAVYSQAHAQAVGGQLQTTAAQVAEVETPELPEAPIPQEAAAQQQSADAAQQTTPPASPPQQTSPPAPQSSPQQAPSTPSTRQYPRKSGHYGGIPPWVFFAVVTGGVVVGLVIYQSQKNKT